MANARRSLNVGDVVRVKPDVIDPDFKVHIGGWQGRVAVINPANGVIRVDWDSVTLQEMPAEIIEQCMTEGLYWHQIYLYPSEVELAAARDTEADAIAMVNRIRQGDRPKDGASDPLAQAQANQAMRKKASATDYWKFPRAAYADHLW